MRYFLRGLATLGALTALWLGVVTPSQADPLYLLLPDAGAFPLNLVPITGFDPGPGNMMITGVAQNGGNLFKGEKLEAYYQATIKALLDANGNPIPPALLPLLNNSYEFTVVARFGEVVTGLTPINGGKGVTVQFDIDKTSPNPFFEVWFHYFTTVQANNFAGTGFAVGEKVLSGEISTVSSSFTVNDLSTLVPIDNPFTSGGTAAGKTFWNNAGTTTVQGTGDALMQLAPASIFLNPTFFPFPQTVKGYSLEASLGLEYKNVDPSVQFDAFPNGGGFIPATAVQGQANGTVAGNLASNLIDPEINDLERFDATPPLPEPSTMVLVMTGVSVLSLVNALRRRPAKT
jgi:hypothetical protein